MPLYEWVCECGTYESVQLTFKEYDDFSGFLCSECAQPMTRLIGSVNYKLSMPEHYNLTTGQYVSNDHDFREQLKIASDEATERLGIPHNFQPVDLSEREALGVTDEGLDSRYARQVTEGRREVKKWL